jgi:hypothetical protein
MFRKIKNFLYTLVTGSVTMLLSACYGPVVQDRVGHITIPNTLNFHVLVQDTNNQPISGIELSSVSNSTTNAISTTHSYSDGNAVVYLPLTNNEEYISNYSIILTDVDGTSNLGQFSSKTVLLDGRYSYTVTLTN